MDNIRTEKDTSWSAPTKRAHKGTRVSSDLLAKPSVQSATEKESSGESDRLVNRERETDGEAITVEEPFVGKRSGETVQEPDPIATC